MDKQLLQAKGTARMNHNESTASYLKALGHPTRLQIAKELMKGELSVGEVGERLNIQQANASQHLNILRTSGIVNRRRKGTYTYYSLLDPGMFKKIIKIFENGHH